MTRLRSTRKHSKRTQSNKSNKSNKSAVAVFHGPAVEGHVVATPCKGGVDLIATFHTLPTGLHGFHIHKAGDMRQKDCMGLCEHYHKGRSVRHGAGPNSRRERHTGDLGNIRGGKRKTVKRYCLPGVSVKDLWGRSIIVHKDEDDLGLGSHADSGTTGHSGTRMAAAVFGRVC
jgi:superoxide dismutase, Cu-Zn family